MTNELIKDFTYRVTQANKTEMIAVLYDIGVVYLKDSLSSLEKGDKEGFRTELTRARNTVRELIASVNTSVELGMNFLSLYIYCSGELTRAYMDYDSDPVYHVISIFERLGEAYHTVSVNDTSGPVMGNTEKIYSGFTYNRSMTTESVSAGGEIRGYLV